MTTKFQGTLLGVEYDDPKAFEKAARGLGYTHVGQNRRAVEWKLGTEVRVRFEDGRRLRGQVWARAEKGYVWLAMEDRTFLSAHVATCHVYTEGRDAVGRVA